MRKKLNKVIRFKKNLFSDRNLRRSSAKSSLKRSSDGSGLIVVILVLAFMMTIGLVVLTVSSSGPKVSSAMRFQEEAFNAAEAGFNEAKIFMEDAFGSRQWTSFAEHYLTQPEGIDIPFINYDINKPNPLYFRRLTDEQILSLLDPNRDGLVDIPVNQVIFFEQPFIQNNKGEFDFRYRYTVFLIDDEAGTGMAADPKDFLMVCIGVVRSGPEVKDKILATCRLEIELEAPD